METILRIGRLDCKIGVTVRQADATCLEQVLDRCRHLGYDAAFLQPENYEPFLGDPAGFLGRWGDWSPLIGGLIVDVAPEEDRAEATAAKAIDLAVGIDGRLLVARLGRPRPIARADRNQPAAAIEQIGHKARRSGLRLSVVNRAGGAFERLADLETFCRACDASAVGLSLHVADLFVCGERDPAAAVRKFALRLENVILADVAETRFPMLEGERFNERPLGEGDVQFQPLFQALESVGYQGWLTVEVEAAQAIGAMSHAISFLKAHGIEGKRARR